MPHAGLNGHHQTQTVTQSGRHLLDPGYHFQTWQTVREQSFQRQSCYGAEVKCRGLFR